MPLYKAFDLTCYPDGPSSFHVIIAAMLKNKRKVIVYYFKIEPGTCISGIKNVIKSRGRPRLSQTQATVVLRHHGQNAEPKGPFGACAVNKDRSLNGMAYYMQQTGLYLDMRDHPTRNWVPRKDRKPNDTKLLHRRPDGRFHCRRYMPCEPEQPDVRQESQQVSLEAPPGTPQWVIGTNTDLTGERAISDPPWVYAAKTGATSNNISGAKSIELCEHNAAIVADVREANNESKLGIFKEQHPNLNVFGLTMVRIDMLKQQRHLMEKGCLCSNNAKKPKPEVIAVVVPLSAESAALCMVDGQTLLGDLHFDLATSGWINWPEQ